MRVIAGNLRKSFVACLALSALLSGPSAQAAVFNPHLIIGDDEIRRSYAMSYEDIRTFLKVKGGLADISDIDAADGLLKNAAQLIDDAAKRYDVNPKYILALIQKESSAVETRSPSRSQLDWATGYALCDGCPRSGGLAQKYKGFARQVDAGAGWIDWYFKNVWTLASLRRPGVPYLMNDIQVTPANLATAALYSYTPHLHGNLLLWSIWNRWFGDGIGGLRFPDGTLIRDQASGAVALIQGGKFRPILNASVLASRFNQAAIVDLDAYQFGSLRDSIPGRPVRFANFSLVRTEDGTTYLLVGSNRRRIASQAAFAKIGFNPEEVEDVLAEDISDYADGQPIALDDSHALGDLLQDVKTGGVYYAEGGVKRPIWDRAVLAANFGGRRITPASRAALDQLKTGDPVRFADGTLVKAPGDPAVYVISGGKKRPIPDEETFLMFGYRFSNVLTASRKMLSLHEDGDPLAIETVAVSADPAAEPAPPAAEVASP
jgi:hypothetical protein